MSAAPHLLSLLRALTSGYCPSELWDAGAIEHYSDQVSEEVRVKLVRVASDAGEWSWPNVPTVLKEKAKDLLNELLAGEE